MEQLRASQNTASPSAPDVLQTHGQALLEEGMRLLTRWSKRIWVAHLYPTGPNQALVFRAVQTLAREIELRQPGKLPSRSRLRRKLQQILREYLERDAQLRAMRVRWQVPTPRPVGYRIPPSAFISNVLSQIDEALRGELEALLLGDITQTASGRPGDRWRWPWSSPRIALALSQFRRAIWDCVLRDPTSLRSLPPYFIYLAGTAPPRKIGRPLVGYFLVQLPLQILAVAAVLGAIGYAAAYRYFNDEVVAHFLTEQISSVLDGELAFERIHWQPSLIVDLITGQPHKVEIRGVRVYEPFKRAQRSTRNETAYAEHLTAHLILHEIVPWNRLGVPQVFDIPWVLHFTEIQSSGDFWIGARDYVDPADKRSLVSLIDAFGAPDDEPPTYGYKQMGFRVDSTDFSDVRVILDFISQSGWGVDLTFAKLDLALVYDGAYPEAPEPEQLPFRYRARSGAANGRVHLLEETLALTDVEQLYLEAGWQYSPLGEFYLHTEGQLEGTPTSFDGSLIDTFSDKPGVDFRVSTTNASPILSRFSPPDTTTQRSLIAGNGPAAVSIRGTLDQPEIEMAAQSLRLDLGLDERWILQDADARIRLRNELPGEMWQHSPVAGERAWVFHFEHLAANALGGKVHLDEKNFDSHLIWPEPGRAFRSQLALVLEGADPAQLLEERSTLAKSLAGSFDGRLKIRDLTYGTKSESPPSLAPPVVVQDFWPAYDHVTPPPARTSQPAAAAASVDPPEELRTVSLQLTDATLHRKQSDDHLPNDMWLQGDFNWLAETGLRIGDFSVGSAGMQTTFTGGFTPDFRAFRPSNLKVDISSPKQFFAETDLPISGPSLAASLTFAGPVLSPRGTSGTLSAPGLVAADLRVDGLESSQLWVDDGALHLRGPKAQLLGGTGLLEVDLQWASRGKLLAEPQIYARAQMQGIEAQTLLGLPVDISQGSFDVEIGGPSRTPTAISKISASGTAQAAHLTIAGIEYSHGRTSYRISQDELVIDQLKLSYDRQVGALPVPVGKIDAAGRIGFAKDPEFAVSLRADDLPLRALTNFIDPEMPVRGRVAAGSELKLNGTLGRPEVSGKVELRGVSLASFALGSGRVSFTSTDEPTTFTSTGMTSASVRKVRVSGDLVHPKYPEAGLSLDGTYATVELSDGSVHAQARASASVKVIPLARLLTSTGDQSWRTSLDGELSGLQIEAQSCPKGPALLDACNSNIVAAFSESDDDDLTIRMKLEDAWIGPGEAPKTSPEHPMSELNPKCPAQATLCAVDPLVAEFTGSQLALDRAWTIANGNGSAPPNTLKVSGYFDLRTPESDEVLSACVDPISSRTPPSHDLGGRSSQSGALGRHGRIDGNLDLSAFSPVLGPLGISTSQGQLSMYVDIQGNRSAPSFLGSIALMPNSPPLRVQLAAGGMTAVAAELTLPSFSAELAEDRMFIDATLQYLGQDANFGDSESQTTGVAFAGPCAGEFGVSMLEGSRIDGRVLQQLFPDAVARSSGAIGIDYLRARGNFSSPIDGSTRIDELSGKLGFGEVPLQVTLDAYNLNFQSGSLDLRNCTEKEPCSGENDGISLFLGSESSASAAGKPRQSLSAAINNRNESRLDLWGEVHLTENASDLHSASLHAATRLAPFRLEDNAGEPELNASLSSDHLSLRLAKSGLAELSGNILVERSRWLRDATQGVTSVVSFADPNPAPPSELPPEIGGIRLDLAMRTTAPFRVDNNVLRGLEAQARLHMGGTFSEPSLTGQIEVSRGQLDLALLGAAYNIERGRVNLDRDLDRSTVELIATRKELVRIDNELHRVTLELAGSLAAIQWRCSSTALRGRALTTAGGCVDYLIFDAGNASLALTEDPSRNPSLPFRSRPLTLVGNLTQKEVNEYIAARAPEVEHYLPKMRVRFGQLGVEALVQTRPEWLAWRWGNLSFGINYLRGYPGGLLRSSQVATTRVQLIDRLAIEANTGARNYTNRAFVLDPANYSSIEFIHTLRIPSVR